MFKAALILQGGGLRGAFTSGVLDVFLENDIEFEYIVGVSAGALNATNYISKQRGRSIHIISEYCDDKKFASLTNLLRRHNYFNMEYLFKDLDLKGHNFDEKTFKNSNVRFYAVATGLNDGKPRYFEKSKNNFNECVIASMSLPLLSTPVEIDKKLYLDGGDSDPIPYLKAMDDGYNKIVIIETKEKEFRKAEDDKTSLLYKKRYYKYPKYLRKVLDYPMLYNKTVSNIESLEEKGLIYVIRPLKKVIVSQKEKDRNKIVDLYNQGKETALRALDSLKEYLNGE
ncbi:MAG: patatin family protein [Erysipelotrichaceae bacterium]|jgi:predicted patatin/cPLA2 family phospholipase|nr:patatin family protein [Erysipelotrichaceae bacterium]